MKLSEARKLIKDLPPALKRHIERTLKLGRELASTHQLSANRVSLAILLHDVARTLEETELLNLAESSGLDITEYDLQIPLLLHGPVGAKALERDDGLKDAEILEAISCHTTGKPGMGKFAKVVFLADKLESGKIEESPELEEVRDLAYKDLDGAMVAYLAWQKEYLKKSGLSLHPLSHETLEHFRQTVDRGRPTAPPGRR